MTLRPHRASALWSVVLAAGQGKRLAPITQALCGRWIPKQFVALTSRRTLLQETLERTSLLAPASRTVVVVSEVDADLAALQLSDYPGVELVRQPADRGTAAGLMLGLAHVRARDPRADVAVFPADHHVASVSAWTSAVRRARAASRIAPSGLVLLGAPADRPSSDLGWIVPGLHLPDDADFDSPEKAHARASHSRISLVDEFVEKPRHDKACLLLAAGGLWNTMVVVGSASALWRLGWCHVPTQMHHFERYMRALRHPPAQTLLARFYERMTPADLSRDILEAAPGLAVAPVVGSGWFDCGTPERLLDWLNVGGDPSGILARVGPKLLGSHAKASSSPDETAVVAASA